MTALIHIGTITQAHGIKGLVKIIPAVGDIVQYQDVIVDADGRSISVIFKNKLGKYILAHLHGVDDRNAAEAAKGTKLYIAESDIAENDTQRFIGMNVVENSEIIGIVSSVENYGAGDLFAVKLSSGEEILLPDHDNYILDIHSVIVVQNHCDLLF